MAINYRGETFQGFNQPKRTPKHPKYSHAVLAKVKDVVKLVRFGQQGVTGSPHKKGDRVASSEESLLTPAKT